MSGWNERVVEALESIADSLTALTVGGRLQVETSDERNATTTTTAAPTTTTTAGA
jgi:hypothetical protein